MAILNGLVIPFQFSDSGGLKTTDPLTKVKVNMQSLLITKLKTRFMQPEQGCNLLNLLGEVADDAFDVLAKKEINEAISRWIPDVLIKEIKIEKTGNEAFIYIKYLNKTFDVTDSLLMQIEV